MKRVFGERMCHKDIKEENIVKYCKNCYGLEPCMCGKPEYIKTWDFVYWVFKKCKM